MTIIKLGDTPIPPSLRDPDDKDPRPKDFDPPNMNTKSLSNFHNAFSPSGFIWIWGCSFPKIMHELLTIIETNSRYKPNGLDDEVVFNLKNLANYQVNSLEIILFEELDRFPNKRNIEIKFKYLKEYFCKANISTFNHIIAKKTGIRTFGALVATYADFQPAKSGLMYVEGARHFRFYKNYLGFNFDQFVRGPFGLGYGEFKPDYECDTPNPPVTSVYPSRGGRKNPMPQPH